MAKSDVYRQKAADSKRQAAQARDAAVKRHHLNLAEAWRMMADRVSAQEGKSDRATTMNNKRS